MSRELLDNEFYDTASVNTRFGLETKVWKAPQTLKKIEAIYTSRLKEVFKYVSHPHVMRNTNKSVMFHFVLLACNNQTAVKIANDIVDKITIN